MWKAITSFFPGGEPSTGKPAGTFTSAAATSAGLPAAAAPILKNKKANSASASTQSSMGSKFPSFSSNLKQGVNYAEPSDEEVYNLKISKPKFNAGDANPFFVNVPAKKYKVLIPDDPYVEPTEEVTNSTLRFYGSSAENVYKKAKTYRTSAKSKHNTLFQKARANYVTRATNKTKSNTKKMKNALDKSAAQQKMFRDKIQKYSNDLNDYLTRLRYAQMKVIPGTALKKGRIMTDDEQKRQINIVKELINQVNKDLEGLQTEIGKVSGLPPDIQTALQGVLGESKKAAEIVASVPVVEPSKINVSFGTKPENRNVLRKASTAGPSQSVAAASTQAQNSSPKSTTSTTSTSSVTAGFAGTAAAAARLAGKTKRSSGTAGSASGAAGSTVGPKGEAAFREIMSKKAPSPPQSALNGAKEAEALLARASAAGTGASATIPPPPIKAPALAATASGNSPGLAPAPQDSPVAAPPAQGTATTAAVPPAQGAAPPVPPAQPNSPWLGGGGSRKRRKQQKKRHARSAKRKTGKSRKY